jgi:hypothetical protein
VFFRSCSIFSPIREFGKLSRSRVVTGRHEGQADPHAAQLGLGEGLADPHAAQLGLGEGLADPHAAQLGLGNLIFNLYYVKYIHGLTVTRRHAA